MREFRVSKTGAGQRLDVFLSEKYAQHSRSTIAKLFSSQVLVNGKPAKSGQKLKTADKIELDDEILTREPQMINLPVVYEDDSVIVIDKPSGILTHSKGGLNLEPSVASFIRPKLADIKLSGNRAGIVHRLDRGTSGLIIAAKNKSAETYLQKQFSTRRVNKKYIAVVSGKLTPENGVIDIPIARNVQNPKTFKASSQGKPATTEYQTLNTPAVDGKIYTLVELRPKTGRTHQLRVHLTYLGHPIVGDEFYQGEPASRLMLHATSLELTLPGGEHKLFESDLPKEFKRYA